MRLEFAEAPVVFAPQSLVFESQQEIDDLKWLTTFNISIPQAIDQAGYPTGSGERAYRILKTIFDAIDNAQTERRRKK